MAPRVIGDTPKFMVVIATILITWTWNVGIARSAGNYEHHHDPLIKDTIEDVFFEILHPPELSYTYRIRPTEDFGTRFNDSFSGRKIALVPVEPETGCRKPDNIEKLDGNVALVWRGDCTFFQKSAIAEDSGAKAIIVADYHTKSIDDERESPMWMDYYYIEMTSGDNDRKRNINIPAGFLLGKNGRIIRDTLRRLKLPHAIINIPVNLTFSPITDFHQPPWVAL
ncbi:PRADC1-like protein [Venturia canescens]|uniref:PRADC1-like protein n=1 Tax=Venturia canescens TaxID=32260 RepID=UPI001C9BBD7F|nr:PRADC1-like protein [Venturia canescens]